MVPPQPRLTSPPPVLWEGEEPQKPSLPSSPLLPPPRGGPLQFVVTALHVRKKKVCRMSHTEKKKKNPKPSEKNLRVGLADGIIKASPEPRLALPLRQPPGEEPRPARPAPSPMDLRAGRSQASEAPAPAREPPDPVPVLPPGSPEPGPGWGAGRCPRPRGSGRGGGARPGALERGRAGTRHSWSPLGGAGRWPERGGRPGRPADLGGGHLEPGEAGSRDPRGPSPAPKSGERVRGGSGSAGGDGARGGGGGRERKRAGGRGARGSPRPGRREARGGRHLGPRRSPSPARREGRKGRAGRRAGERRKEGGGQSRAGLVRAGPRESRLPRCAPRGRSPPCCLWRASRRQVGAGRRPRAPRAGPPWPGSD